LSSKKRAVKNFLPRAAAAVVAALQLMGQAMSQPTCDLMKIAQEQITIRFPDFDPTGMTPVVLEKGDFWELTYQLPSGMLGGAPIVTIDKRTCTVIRVEHSQ
jgi:hypothetical protein